MDDTSLYWEDSFEIMLTLQEQYPHINLDEVSLGQLENWILDLPNFADDPLLVNETILTDILRDWYEESDV